MHRIERNNMTYLLCAFLVLIGVLFRIIPHAPNFTPMLTIALMSGLYIKNRFSILLPILIMLVSDLFIGSHIIAPWVYVSILIIYLIGRLIKNNALNVLLSSILSSILFFIVTNFGVWISGGYLYSFKGLMTCYIMAIPFFKNTLISTVLFSGLVYFLHYFLDLVVLKYQKNKI